MKRARRLAVLLVPSGSSQPGREKGGPVRPYALDADVLADLARRYNPAAGGENESSSLLKPAESVDDCRQTMRAGGVG